MKEDMWIKEIIYPGKPLEKTHVIWKEDNVVWCPHLLKWEKASGMNCPSCGQYLPLLNPQNREPYREQLSAIKSIPSSKSNFQSKSTKQVDINKWL